MLTSRMGLATYATASTFRIVRKINSWSVKQRRRLKFAISEEIWHFSQPFEHGNALGNLWPVSYPVRKNLVIDGGFNHGLTKTSTQSGPA
jgi:hypothetical protein